MKEINYGQHREDAENQERKTCTIAVPAVVQFHLSIA
jgi:hypothetical protein